MAPQKSKEKIRNGFKHINWKRLALLVLVILIAAGLIVSAAIMHYNAEKSNLFLQGELAARHSADQVERSILTNKNALLLSQYVIDNMLRLKAPSEEIGRYLTEESERMIETLDEGFTGLYGWFDGEYLDGSGWVPPDDFVPTERPWYKAAMETPGELAMVEPYLDAKTGTMMMTIAALLDDGESVIALDVMLEGIQGITARVSSDVLGGNSMILDHDGCVVAHSIRDEIGKNYLRNQDGIGSAIAERIYADQEEKFEIRYEGRNYVVYSVAIEDDWRCVAVIDSADFYNPLKKVLAIGIAMVLVIIIFVIIIFLRLNRRNLITQDLNIQLKTIADIYTMIIDINLETNSFSEIINKENLSALIQDRADAQQSLWEACDNQASEMSRPVLHTFLDLSTLRDRLQDHNDLAIEFQDKARGWARGRFIVAKRNDNGKIIRVLWAIESIDEEKKHRDHLQHLAETDQLTNIYNRASGEHKIEMMLEQGRTGMFLMLDIDHFKSINDRFGHRVGDLVIIQVAGCLRNAFRTGDIVLRLGGDEFAAYAPGVHTPEIAENILKRFFKHLGNISIEELKGEEVCVSVGVAFYKEGEKIAFQKLYQHADRCTYESKKTRGSKVTYYDSLGLEVERVLKETP